MYSREFAEILVVMFLISKAFGMVGSKERQQQIVLRVARHSSGDVTVTRQELVSLSTLEWQPPSSIILTIYCQHQDFA